MDVKRSDVVIVGGGPGGTTLAALLGARGVAVTLIERETFPRDKLCGEFLSYDALPIVDRLGVDLRGAPPIHGCRVVAGRRSYEFEFPHASRGISRVSLDQLLVDAAMRNGAQVITGRSVNSLDEVSGSITVGAWGRWCRIDKDLNRTFVRERRRRSFGFKRHYRGKSNNGLISLYSFKRGYMGVTDVENDTVNICGLVDASRLTRHKGRWESFVEALRQEEPAVESAFAPYEPAQETFLSSTPVVFRPRSPVANGVFMVGDASGIVDPLAGNGMAMAIQSALVLAPLLVRLLENPNARTSIEAEYCSTHAELFLPRIRWSRRVAKLLSRPALLEPALRAARGPLVGSFAFGRTRGNRDAFVRLADDWRWNG